jgi:hypothetical protein
VRVFLGDGKGHWTESSTGLAMPDGTCGGAIATGDVNKDGKLDLAVADHCTGLFVFLGDGKGAWKPAVSRLTPDAARMPKAEDPGADLSVFIGAESIGIGDVNEDGFADLVAAASDRGGFSVWFGDGSGAKWRESKQDGLPSADDPPPGEAGGDDAGWATELRLVDMNRDSHLDVVAAYHLGGRVWLGDGKGRWTPASEGLPSATVAGLYFRMAVGDLNGDGRPDLVLANIINGAEVYLQQPNGAWRAAADPMPSLRGGAHAVTLGDFDGDHVLDLVIAGRQAQSNAEDFGIYVFRGTGSGEFVAWPSGGLPEGGQPDIVGMTAADVNGDGRPDLLVCGARLPRPRVRGATPTAEPQLLIVYLTAGPTTP